MMEKSFLIFKPNNYGFDKIYLYILDQLKFLCLVIEKEYTLTLSPSQMNEIWPRLCSDKLLYYTMKEMYKEPVKIMELIGEEAIAKVDKLKKEIRIIYATGIIRNCIHAPANKNEYIQHIGALHGNINERIFRFPTLKYDCYKLLNIKLCTQLAKKIINISLYSMIHSSIPYENTNKKFRYYLAEDEIHTFTDYVCFIYDNFPQFNFETSTIMATILETYGEVCLIDTNRMEDADLLLSNGLKKNMIIKIHVIKTTETIGNDIRKF